MTPGRQSAPGAASMEGGNGTLLAQMGGLEGIIFTSLPVLVIVVGRKYLSFGTTLVAALLVAAAYLVWRLARKQSLRPAISAFIGVGIGAGIAWFTGEAKGFFLYGIWMSLIYAVLFIASILIRWPAVGVIWLGITGHGMAWRAVKKAVVRYDIATALWAIVFAARFVVQHKLYAVDNTDALGIARLVMGLPLTALVMLVTVWLVRRARGDIEAFEQATGKQILHPELAAGQASSPETTSGSGGDVSHGVSGEPGSAAHSAVGGS